jgi:multidrug efflux pump subunit AcrB
MWIVLLALRRPYTFVVAALLLVILTPFILLRTPTDIFPAINIPVVSIIWSYTGLDAQQMEQRITYVNERALTVTVNNIEHIESTSYNGISVIKVFLQPKASVDSAVAQITAVGQTVLRQMPPGMTPPLVIQYNASTVPILQYSFSSSKMSEQQLFDVTANQVRIGLADVPGAMIPWPYGGKQRVVAVDLSLPALKDKNIQAQDVVNAINAQNLVLPSGTAKIGSTEYSVAVDANAHLINDLNHLPIKIVNGATIYLSDVAQVHDGYNAATKCRASGRRARRVADHHEGGRRLDAGRGEQGQGRAATRDGLGFAGFARQGICRPVAVRARGHQRRLEGRHHRRRADRRDDPALPRFVAQHVHHRAVHPAGRALLHRDLERAG